MDKEKKYYDLSQKFQVGMTTTKSLGPFQQKIISDLDHHHFQVSQITFATHLGCHMDAPRHYYKDGTSIGDIPIERLVSRCVVIDAQKGKHGLITVEDIQKSKFGDPEGGFCFLLYRMGLIFREK